MSSQGQMSRSKKVKKEKACMLTCTCTGSGTVEEATVGGGREGAVTTTEAEEARRGCPTYRECSVQDDAVAVEAAGVAVSSAASAPITSSEEDASGMAVAAPCPALGGASLKMLRKDPCRNAPS